MDQVESSVADAAKSGGMVAISLFMVFYVLMMVSADSITEAVDIFERSLLTVIFAFVPTTGIGAVISVFSGAIAAKISLDDFDPSMIRAIVVFAFIYTLTNIVINWFTAPV